ncbi:MAG: GNAT family N-acetyltransferase [Acidimicrobiia bacterium]|jgi:GNAT superfamily N-acetyltransferase
MTEPPFDIREARIGSGVGAALTGAQWRELMARYGVPETTTDDLAADHLEPPTGVFLVAWDGDAAVGCGGVRSHDDTTGEIKRMYVAPDARRRGVSRIVLRALEDRARAIGYTRLVLETGTKQPEAIALYESEGYTRIAGYGYYRDAPDSRCYGKDLA